MLKLKLSPKGEIVIPKKVRDQLGLTNQREVVMEVKENAVVLHQASGEDIVKRWEARAKRINADVSKWVLGDALYEEGEGF